ncbi:MAG TPA: hypothetical protein VHG28_22315 [Longimicrobiaceae bacterium]|nr:hypothetical protein [Longimicrobiaceae bacterium]
MDQLFDTFPDHQPSLVSESADGWTFELCWTSDPQTFVDPGVADTAARVYGLRLPNLGGYREVTRWGVRDVVFSMVHAWALVAPALAVQRRGGKPLAWVIHLDDHTDLMAPAVEPGGRLGLLRDRIFGIDIDVADPASITAAVERGTVSKGNFLTAYLLAYPGCQVVHVGERLAERSFALQPRKEAVDLGGVRFPRTALPLTRDPEPGTPAFRQTRTLPPELPSQGEGGVWLDIDLDYFCNRYDGDSDLRERTAAPGETGAVMARVWRFLAELGHVRWLGQVEAVSVAVSPGFFPADHWAEVVPALREGLQKVLGE